MNCLRSIGAAALVATLALVAGCDDKASTANDSAIAADLTTAPDLTTPAGNDSATAADLTTAKDAATGSDGTVSGATVDVTVGPNGTLTFQPKDVSVNVGDTVRWTWMGNNHTVTSGANAVADDKFCSPSDAGCQGAATSSAGAVYMHKFTVAGAFPYYCRPHIGAGMIGSVTVK